MRIAITSNIVSGIHEVLEVILCTLIVYCIKIIIGALHLKKLYHGKATVQLSYSRMYISSNFGVTIKQLYRLSVIVTVTVILLISVGGFAFTGIAVESYEDVPVKYLVTRAEQGEVVDLNRHVSFENGLFSGTLLMMNLGARCWSDIRNKTFYYAYHHEDEIRDFDDRIFEISDVAQTNVRCNGMENGFKTEVALEYKSVGEFAPIGNNCTLPFDLRVPHRKITMSNFTFGEQCDIQVEEAWCYRDEGIGCALHVHQPDGSSTVTYLRMGDQSIIYKTNRLALDEQPMAPLLQWFVLLYSVESLRNASMTPQMALMTVKRDTTVQKFIGFREETRVNALLLALTLGPAILVTIFTALVALDSWVRYVYLPGRTSYNCCNSAMDILKFAACVAFEEGKTDIRYEKDVFVGVSRLWPHVGPVPKEYAVKRKNVDVGAVFGEGDLE